MLPEASASPAHVEHHPALAHHFDNLEQQHEAATLGMWVFLVTEVMFFGGAVRRLRDLSRLVPGRVRRGQPHARHRAGHDQHGRADHQQPDDGAGRARRADGRAAPADAVPGADDAPGRACSSASRGRVRTTSSPSTTCPGASFHFEEEALSASRADVLLALLRDDRPARAAHGHRPRDPDVDAVVGVERHDHAASTTARSRSAGCTGTSSTSSGSSCSRCCI